MRVLIADGDEVFLSVAQRYLSDYGHQVHTATNGLETVASLRQDLPDVVVINQDLRWGGSDGVQSLMSQVPIWSDIPVVLTVNEGLQDKSRLSIGPSVVARIIKPFRPSYLLFHLQACSLNRTPSMLSVVIQGGSP